MLSSVLLYSVNSAPTALNQNDIQKETFDLRPLVVEAVTNQINQVLAERIEEDRTRRNPLKDETPN